MNKILLVDDDVELAAGLASVLSSEGYEVETRETLDDARQALFGDPPDLLVLDVMFPENPAGGFDLARELRTNEKTKKLPVILLTAVNQELPMDFSAADIDDEWMPVQDFLEKPPAFPELIAKVKKLLQQ
ncbi:MAG: response regulator transcription factor [Spirochaetales bacterium]|jgi:DNA-binding response OmpR family regulator|nr:response regulator transcription factor [Spirochaetales bacterium]